MSMQVECAHEILEASFDGTCTDEERLEFVQVIDAHPEMIESLVQEAFIHSLLQWDGGRTSRN
jgi:tellurite resistance protein